MTLLNQNVIVPGQLAGFFEKLKEGTAPEKFTREHLKDIGFKSSNHMAFIPLLKGLGFLTQDGTPTDRYRTFLDKTQSGKVIADAISENYSDIFVIKARPTAADKKVIEGKYKSTYNLSDTSSERAASTFLALLEIADKKHLYEEEKTKPQSDASEPENNNASSDSSTRTEREKLFEVGLRYNIQIHLPATKDIEVYNAIFKSVREHLIE